MKSNFTVKDLVDFIQKNKGTKVFRNTTETEIVGCILHGIKHNTLVFNVNKYGKINGLIHGGVDKEKKEIHVWNILAIEKNVMKKLILKLIDLWPNYSCKAERRDKDIYYNVPKLKLKLQ